MKCECCKTKQATRKDFRTTLDTDTTGSYWVCGGCFNLNDYDFFRDKKELKKINTLKLTDEELKETTIQIELALDQMSKESEDEYDLENDETYNLLLEIESKLKEVKQ